MSSETTSMTIADVEKRQDKLLEQLDHLIERIEQTVTEFTPSLKECCPNQNSSTDCVD